MLHKKPATQQTTLAIVRFFWHFSLYLTSYSFKAVTLQLPGSAVQSRSESQKQRAGNRCTSLILWELQHAGHAHEDEVQWQMENRVGRNQSTAQHFFSTVIGTGSDSCFCGTGAICLCRSREKPVFCKRFEVQA